jgi:hypothetical protein
VAVIGVILAIGRLDHGNALQKMNNNLQAAQLDAGLEGGMVQIDKYFASHPALRPFFFSQTRGILPVRTRVRFEAKGTAEMLIDFADDVGAYSRRGRMMASSERRWTRIIRPYFAQSPVMRQIWNEAYVAYDGVTACFLGAPDSQEMEGWHWQANKPEAPRPKTCT